MISIIFIRRLKHFRYSFMSICYWLNCLKLSTNDFTLIKKWFSTLKMYANIHCLIKKIPIRKIRLLLKHSVRLPVFFLYVLVIVFNDEYIRGSFLIICICKEKMFIPNQKIWVTHFLSSWITLLLDLSNI